MTSHECAGTVLVCIWCVMVVVMVMEWRGWWLGSSAGCCKDTDLCSLGYLSDIKLLQLRLDPLCTCNRRAAFTHWYSP